MVGRRSRLVSSETRLLFPFSSCCFFTPLRLERTFKLTPLLCFSVLSQGSSLEVRIPPSRSRGDAKGSRVVPPDDQIRYSRRTSLLLSSSTQFHLQLHPQIELYPQTLLSPRIKSEGEGEDARQTRGRSGVEEGEGLVVEEVLRRSEKD